MGYRKGANFGEEIGSFLAGVAGIGPATRVLETRVIPLHHTPSHASETGPDLPLYSHRSRGWARSQMVLRTNPEIVRAALAAAYLLSLNENNVLANGRIELT